MTLPRLCLLLALTACGKAPAPTQPATGCVVVDTVWRSGDTTLVLKLHYPADRCPLPKR